MAITSALLSVSDKTGIVDFAKGLHELGITIISSGGTAKTLKENGIPCKEVSDVTGFPEILDGRVKTLQPKIHGGILAIREKQSHQDDLKKHGITPIDIVVVNLYPFEATSAKYPKTASGTVPQQIVEDIDIGGVALLRASAKNFNDVLVLCENSDYAGVLAAVKTGTVSYSLRKELAAKAFRHTAYYDSLISGYFTDQPFSEKISLGLTRIAGLRYGENPHQSASLYALGTDTTGAGIVSAKQHQGKELSYNNYLDMDSAWKLVNEFEKPACAIIKHNNPCGCAEDADIKAAYLKAYICDTTSAFGGVVAFNKPVGEDTALEVTKIFTECIIAPAYTDEAMKIFAAKKNLRILTLPVRPTTLPHLNAEFRQVSGGMLVQNKDNAVFQETKPVTRRTPSAEELASLTFAMKVCKHVKSNAIVLVKGKQAVGIGAGQMSRIDSLQIAAHKMSLVPAELQPQDKPLVMASDAFFPFNDVVLESAKAGIKAIIQPGGSINDDKSITAADANGMAMVMTGMRHFRH